MLTDPSYPVPEVPAADHGVAWLRSQVVRFSNGAVHQRRRALVQRLLEPVDPEQLRRTPGRPLVVLARALGMPSARDADIHAVAAAYQPHLPITGEADRAVGRLIAAAGGVWDERSANRVALLVQASAGIEPLLRGDDPPIPATRRIGPDGATVEIDLSATPFGAGAHACPGREHALALAGFERMHYGDTPLVLPNAWDFSSAAALADVGFRAVGTTSLGVASINGLADADGVALEQTLAAVRLMSRVPVHVTVDAESGFGLAPEDLAHRLIEVGAVGINLEDGRGDRLADPGEQVEYLHRFKSAAPNLFLNARTDTHWLDIDADQTLDRIRRYVDAGADGVFVPGLTDDHGIEQVVAAAGVPVNLLAQRPVPELANLGVRRISTGSLLFRVAVGATVRAAEGIRAGAAPPSAPGYGAVDDLARRWPDRQHDVQ